MLSVTTVTASQASSYYTHDDYYTGKNGIKVEGEWLGKGAEKLGLSGAVAKEDFQFLLDGKNPANGEGLTGRGGPEHRAGYDMTFSAPKSVSIARDAFRDERIQDAHDKAVKAVMERFESRYAVARETHDGITETVRTGNIIAAKFDHHTSRAGDPQMHSHVVLLNVTKREDGQWRALEGHTIYKHKMALGQEYRSELAANLKELGYQIEKDGKGGFEIQGFTKEIRDEFSRRSGQIKEVLDDLREKYPLANESQLKEMATLETREAKGEKSIEERQAEIDARLEKMGLTREALHEASTQQREQREPGQETTPGRTAEEYVRLAADIIHEGESAFTKEHLQEIATRISIGEQRVSEIENAIDELSWKGEIQRLDWQGENKEPFYSTKAMIETEKRIRDTVLHGQGKTSGIDEAGDRLQKWQDEHGITLTDGQRNAAEMILSTTDRYVGVQGNASTGKTTMLAVVNDIAKEEGQTVRGMAFTGKAASEIEASAGIKSDTLDVMLGRFERMNIVTPEQQTVHVKEYQAALDKFGGEKALQEVQKPVTREERDRLGGISSMILDTKMGFRLEDDRLGNKAAFSTIRQETWGSSLGSDIKADIEKRFGSTIAGKLFSDGQTKAEHTYNVVVEWDGKMERAIQNIEVTRQKDNPDQVSIDISTLHKNGDISKTHISHFSDGRSVAQLSTIEPPDKNIVKGKETWVVDEASMVGAKKMEKLIANAEKAEAKVVLIGDMKQLQAIDASQTFKDLQEAGMKTERMSELVRQTEKGYKEIVAAMSAKNVDAALEKLDKGGQLHIADTPKKMKEGIVNEYLRKGEKDTIIVMGRNADRRDMNNQIRENLKDQGKIKAEQTFSVREAKELGPEAVRQADSYEKGDIVIARQAGIMGRAGTEGRVIGTDLHSITVRTQEGKEHQIDVEKHGGRLSAYRERVAEIGAGDRIVFGQNDRGLGVKNGQTSEVKKINGDRISVKMENGKTVDVNTRSQYNYISHGYAVTDYKAQGQTAKNVIYNADMRGDRGNYNQAYTAITRGKESLSVWTNEKEKLREVLHREVEKTSTLTRTEKTKEKVQTGAEKTQEKTSKAEKKTEARIEIVRLPGAEGSQKETQKHEAAQQHDHQNPEKGKSKNSLQDRLRNYNRDDQEKITEKTQERENRGDRNVQQMEQGR